MRIIKINYKSEENFKPCSKIQAIKEPRTWEGIVTVRIHQSIYRPNKHSPCKNKLQSEEMHVQCTLLNDVHGVNILNAKQAKHEPGKTKFCFGWVPFIQNTFETTTKKPTLICTNLLFFGFLSYLFESSNITCSASATVQ